MSQNYPFTGNAQTFGNDFAVNEQFPGVLLGGTEANALYYEDREVGGTKYYNVQNATYNKVSQTWLPLDITKPAYAMAVTPNGATQFLTAAAGVSPITSWSTLWSIGNSGLSGTAGTISTSSTTYETPVFGLRVSDSSAKTTNPLAQGDDGMLPAIRVEVTATGTGQPNPIYAFVFGNSTTANGAFNQSNLVGAMLGAQIGQTDTHSGVWGANALALSLRTDQNADFQMFGFEANVFNDWKDSGGVFPQATWFKCGIASTSSGNYPIHVGYVSTFSQKTTAQSPTTGNRPHVGFVLTDAIDFGLVLGDVSTSSIVSGGPLQMAVGAKFSQVGVSSGSAGTNYGSVSAGFYLDVATGANTSVEHAFFLSAQPQATSGANPGEQLQVQYNTGGAVILTLDAAGDLAVNGSVGTGGASGPTWKSGTGAPAYTAPKGSMYSRTDGAVGTTLYVTQGGGTWAAVAGV